MNVQKFLQFCIEKLVDQTDAIVITNKITPEKNIYEIKVAPSDLAKLIGREGRTFKALRSLIMITSPDERYELVIDTSN